jgi:hypothetical protein
MKTIKSLLRIGIKIKIEETIIILQKDLKDLIKTIVFNKEIIIFKSIKINSSINHRIKAMMNWA